jgi:hypothetical protein
VAGVSDVSVDGKVIRLQLSGDFDPLLRALSGSYVEDVEVQEPTLEEIFLRFYSAAPVVNHRKEASL